MSLISNPNPIFISLMFLLAQATSQCSHFTLNNSQSHFLSSHPTQYHPVTLTLTLIHLPTHPHLHSHHMVVAIC